MQKRVLSGIVLTIVTITVLLLGKETLALTTALLSGLAFLELTNALGIRKDKKLTALEKMGIFSILLYEISLYLFFTFQVFIPFFMIAVLALIWILFMFLYVFKFPEIHSNEVIKTFAAFIYGPVLLEFVYMTRTMENGIYYVWLIFISSWVCDTCAYAVGVTIGKHRLAPVLSPKKSIEGSIGGILGSMLVGFLYGQFYVSHLVNLPYIGVLLGLISGIGAMISQVGDLAASGIKRNYQIKDYGKIIPGHGGIMDRFDSVIFTGPIVYLLLAFFTSLI